MIHLRHYDSPSGRILPNKLKHFDAYGQNARPAGWNPALQARGRVAGRMPALEFLHFGYSSRGAAGEFLNIMNVPHGGYCFGNVFM